MHTCPIHHCEDPVTFDKLMCRNHWRMVPVELQTALWSAYHRRAKDAAAHRHAMQQCIEAVNGRLAAKGRIG